MGYITFIIKQNDELRNYILFHAEYINEAWVAELKDDDSTKIIKQFDCKKGLYECLDEAVLCLDYLGEVCRISSNDVDENLVKIFHDKLISETPEAIQIPRVSFSQSLQPYKNMWSWLSNSLPDFGIAS